jgi:hypothetical protein
LHVGDATTVGAAVTSQKLEVGDSSVLKSRGMFSIALAVLTSFQATTGMPSVLDDVLLL